MNVSRIIVIFGLLAAALTAAGQDPGGKVFSAFSLGAAEGRLRASSNAKLDAVQFLGGITRVKGLIVDPAIGDCILIGEADPSSPPLRLDDLVVLLRTVFLYQDSEAPGVTIDPNPDSPRTGKQIVRYFGHIEGTHVAAVCFDSDYLMKRIGLGLEPPRVGGVIVYWDAVKEDARNGTAQTTEVVSRFWFYPVIARVISVGNGVLLDRCELAVLTEVLAATVDGAPVRDLDRFCDGPADTYSKSFSSHFDALAGAWTSIDELRGITAFSALCRGLARTEPAPRLDYWMHEYEVPVVPTTTEADVLGNTSAELGVEVYGGVCLEALSLRLKDGDLTAFSNAIIESRPSADALTWSVAVSPDNEIRALGLGDGAAMYSVVEAYSRGDHLFRAKDYDHAIACWLEVARQCPESGEVFWRIGRAFERKGMVACAADYYTKALEQDPFLNCPAVLIVEEK